MKNIFRIYLINKILICLMVFSFAFMLMPIDRVFGQTPSTSNNSDTLNKISEDFAKKVRENIEKDGDIADNKTILLLTIFPNSDDYSPYTEAEIDKCLLKQPTNSLARVEVNCLQNNKIANNNTLYNNCKAAGGNDKLCTAQQQQAQQKADTPNAVKPTTSACQGVGTWWLLGADHLVCLALFAITNLIFSIVSFCAKLMSDVFSLTIEKFILNISKYFPTDSGAIYSIWSGFRDITNILVFFSAILIGLRRIMGDNSENTAFIKNVLKVFLFALMVNFSYPISRFFIDISNVFSLFIYSSVAGAGDAAFGTLISSITNFSKIAQAVSTSGADIWGVVIISIIFMVVIFITFAVLSVMVMTRVVILILCVIFSPLMFASGFLGVLDDWHSKWRENYIGMLIYTPLLMLGIYISFSFLDVVKIQDSSGEIKTTTFNIVLSLLVFILCVKIANNASGSIGKAVSGFVGGATKTLALGGIGLGAGLALRSGLGSMAGKVRNSKWIQNQKENGGFFGRNFATLADNGASGIQNTRFKVGKYGVSDTYSNKVNEKKGELNNKLSYLDRTNPAQALKVREALRKQGNTVGDVKNIANVVNYDDRQVDLTRKQLGRQEKIDNLDSKINATQDAKNSTPNNTFKNKLKNLNRDRNNLWRNKRKGWAEKSQQKDDEKFRENIITNSEDKAKYDI